MSNELDSQITESVFKDKILKFYNKKKYYLFALFFLLLCLPIFYQVFLSIDKKKHSSQFEKYSELILNSTLPAIKVDGQKTFVTDFNGDNIFDIIYWKYCFFY